MKKVLLSIFTCLLFVLKSFSQTIPVGDYAETLARMYQILGTGNQLSSFTQRPLDQNFVLKTDSALQGLVAGKNLAPKFNLFGIPSCIKILPFTWLNEYNTKLPYGYNDGPLFPNVGYQTLLTGGVFVKAGVFNIQIKPELVYAENKPFPTFGTVYANKQSSVIGAYWYFFNALDAPERFGANSDHYTGAGQSKITLSLFNLEAGVSTENIWWGPGVQNSLMMSNSAPGFLHWTFNTVAPVKTIVGSFEWQIIGGKLKQSGEEQYEASTLPNNSTDYIPKPKVDRYISGFTFNWHPKWIEGLFLGASGYEFSDIDATFDNKSFIKRLLPVFFPISSKTNTIRDNNKEDGDKSCYAVNMRQLFSKDKADVYIEYARNDNFASTTDLVLEPEHASAYTIGTDKFFQLKESGFIKVNIELTHLQLPDTFLLRQDNSFYVHEELNPLDGYTNEGRFVGAGIGPGSNDFMVDISYIKNVNSFGIKFERFLHNNDLYYAAFSGTTGNADLNWVDCSGTFYAKIKLKKCLISAEYVPVYTYNYEYLRNYNITNMHARVSLQYFFN